MTSHLLRQFKQICHKLLYNGISIRPAILKKFSMFSKGNQLITAKTAGTSNTGGTSKTAGTSNTSRTTKITNTSKTAGTSNTSRTTKITNTSNTSNTSRTTKITNTPYILPTPSPILEEFLKKRRESSMRSKLVKIVRHIIRGVNLLIPLFIFDHIVVPFTYMICFMTHSQFKLVILNIGYNISLRFVIFNIMHRDRLWSSYVIDTSDITANTVFNSFIPMDLTLIAAFGYLLVVNGNMLIRNSNVIVWDSDLIDMLQRVKHNVDVNQELTRQYQKAAAQYSHVLYKAGHGHKNTYIYPDPLLQRQRPLCQNTVATGVQRIYTELKNQQHRRETEYLEQRREASIKIVTYDERLLTNRLDRIMTDYILKEFAVSEVAHHVVLRQTADIQAIFDTIARPRTPVIRLALQMNSLKFMIETRDKILLKKMIAVIMNNAPYDRSTIEFVSVLNTLVQKRPTHTKEELLMIYNISEKFYQTALINKRISQGRVHFDEVNRCLTRLTQDYASDDIDTHTINYLNAHMELHNVHEVAMFKALVRPNHRNETTRKPRKPTSIYTRRCSCQIYSD
jgi:predicted DNA-binding protein YlxM (UPF0122 family)